MSLRSTVRRAAPAGLAALAGVLALLVPGTATALTGPAPAPALTAEVVNAPTGRPGETAPHVTITFRDARHRTAQDYLSCNVYLPLVNSNYTTRTMDWQAGTTCNMPVVMSGYTYVTHWGGSVIANGSTYNTWPGGAIGTSGGTLYGVQNDTYGVTHKVTVDIPSGVTTTAGQGCMMINDNQSISCSLVTGPIYFQA